MSTERPDLRLLEDVVSVRILDAARAAHRFLTERGIRHVLVGGLAIGAHGHPRATKDVDFLVDDNAFQHHGGGIVTLLAPVQVGGVAVDYLAVATDEPFLKDLFAAPNAGTLPVIPVEALLYMKLKAGRTQDVADVVALMKSGIDVAGCRRWLQSNAPRFVTRFDQLEQVALAEAE